MEGFRKLELRGGRFYLNGKLVPSYSVKCLDSLPLRNEEHPLDEGVIFNARPDNESNAYYVGKGFGALPVRPVLYLKIEK